MNRNFLVEIEVTGEDGKIITLDADEMDIYIYQKQNGEQVRVFEIESKVIATDGMLETTCEYVGSDDMEEPVLGSHEATSMSIVSEM